MNTEFWQDARWLVHQMDLFNKRALLLPVNEETYRSSVFMDERLNAPKEPNRIVPLWTLDKDRPQQMPAPVYLFHVGHCGSTLLSRVLQMVTRWLPLREPVPLRSISQLVREKGDPLETVSPDDCDHILDLSLSIYSRVFPHNPRALIKPTSSCCNLIEAVLGQNPESKAVFLYLNLDSFLATLLRSDLRRQETVNFASSRLADLHALLNDTSVRLWQLNAGSMTALSWSANMLWMQRATQSFGNRILPIDFEAMLAEPGPVLKRITEHLDLSIPEPALLDAFEHVTGGYSKDPTMKYSVEQRNREIDAGRKANSKDVDAGERWLDNLAASHSQIHDLAPYRG